MTVNASSSNPPVLMQNLLSTDQRLLLSNYESTSLNYFSLVDAKIIGFSTNGLSQNPTLIVGNNVVIKAPMASSNGGSSPCGTVIFNGNTAILYDIGASGNKLQQLSFDNQNTSNTAIVLVAGNLYSANTTINNFVFEVIGDNLTFALGNSTFTNSTVKFKGQNATLNLADNIVNLNNRGFTLTNNFTFITEITGADQTDVSAGHMNLLGNSTITMADDIGPVNIQIVDNTTGSGSYSVQLFTPTGYTEAALPFGEAVAVAVSFGNNPINVTTQDSTQALYFYWTYDPFTYSFNSGDPHYENLLGHVEAGGGSPPVVEIATILANQALATIEENKATPTNSVLPNTAVVQIVNNLGLMTAAQIVTAIQAMIPNEVASEAMDTASLALSDHFSNLIAPFPDAVGMNSGDEDIIKRGVWGSFIYNEGRQKATKELISYRSKVKGYILGGDVQFNDQLLLGAAVSYVDNHIKHSEDTKSDLSKVESTMLSLYIIYDLTDNLFVKVVLSGAYNKVANYETRIINKSTNQLASSKYHQNFYNADVTFGYDYQFNNEATTFTPLVGINASRHGKIHYQEVGASILDLKVAKKANIFYEGKIGARIFSNYNLPKFQTNFRPELHGFANFALNNPTQQTKFTLDGLDTPIIITQKNSTKSWYNLGTKLSAKQNNIIYYLGYDLILAKKYVGHQGSFKLKVMF